MFGRKKNKQPVGQVVVDQATLRQLSERELYRYFLQETWRTLSKESRIALVQEIENRRAAIDGRPPIPVVEGNDERFRKSAGLMGGYTDAEKVIRLTYRFFEDDHAYYNGLHALRTVLHEGRHAYQHFVTENRPEAVTDIILKEWLSSQARYYSTAMLPKTASEALRRKIYSIYRLQQIEMDARRFARRQMIDIARMMGVNGQITPEFMRNIEDDLQEELGVMQECRMWLTIEEIDFVESQILDSMRKRFPDLKIDGLHLFDHARKILLRPRLDTVKEKLELLMELDADADRKMDANMDQKTDQVVMHHRMDRM